MAEAVAQKIWDKLNESDGSIPDLLEYAAAEGISVREAIDGMNSLLARDIVIQTPVTHVSYELSEDAKAWASEGTPERQLFDRIAAAGPDGYRVVNDAVCKAGSGVLNKQRLVQPRAVQEPGPDGKPVKVTFLTLVPGAALRDDLGKFLADVQAGRRLTEADMRAWRVRHAIVAVKEKTFALSRGPSFAAGATKRVADLTRAMLSAYAAGKAPLPQVKPPNWAAHGKPAPRGYFHPLMEMRREVAAIFTEMGFSEMPTPRWVESSFWNFDALYQPQHHPARDAQDTFFCGGAASTPEVAPREYVERVCEAHQSGGPTLSCGYRSPWDLREAQRNVLRTHTTAVSTRMLYGIAQEWREACAAAEAAGLPRPPIPSRKYFSIDRVFRNETLDATHLAEFHQIEGVVVAPGLTIGHLMGTIREFFTKFGMSDISFKPTYNPYTEPSLEVYAYHPQLGHEIEVGNSGIFRPEMLQPMGFPEDLVVIAWGLGLERPTMIKYGFDNIRLLVGSETSIRSSIREVPLCIVQGAEETASAEQ